EIENARTKCINAGVIPRTGWLAWFWFFAKINKFHFLVQKNRATFAYIFTARYTNNRFDIVGKIDKSFVVSRIDKDVAVIQDKRRIAGEIAREIDNAPGSILHHLRRILYFDVVTRTIAEEILDGLGAVADNNQETPDARVPQSFDNVLQNRLATHLDHRFGKIGGHLPHPRASPGCEQNRFVYPCHESTRVVRFGRSESR